MKLLWVTLVTQSLRTAYSQASLFPFRYEYECRCDERLKAEAEGSTRLTYTWLRGGLEHLKIGTRLIDERFASVMGGCEIVTLKVRHL
jgi:hypothetical protein